MDEFYAIGRAKKDFTVPAAEVSEEEGVTRVNLDGVSNGSIPSTPDFSGFGSGGLSGPDDFSAMDSIDSKKEDAPTETASGQSAAPVDGQMPADGVPPARESTLGTTDAHSEEASDVEQTILQAPYVMEEELRKDNVLEQNIASVFHRISVSDEILQQYSKKYNTELEAVECIADSKKLLSYMVEQERKHAITMPFHATGIDPICFFNSLDEDSEAPFVGIELPDGEQDFYECIEVDNALFLSCVSRVIDEDYLQRIISEAAEALYTHGIYRYTMRGPKPLRTEVPGQMLETLKLNTYELSILQSYMDSIPGVSHTLVKEDDHTVIVFRKED